MKFNNYQNVLYTFGACFVTIVITCSIINCVLYYRQKDYGLAYMMINIRLSVVVVLIVIRCGNVMYVMRLDLSCVPKMCFGVGLGLGLGQLCIVLATL